MTTILGIDPGLQHTGWGVIAQKDNTLSFIASGTISIPAKLTMAERLIRLSDALSHVINDINPDEVAIEETFVNKNPATSLKLGHARGAILLTIAQSGHDPTEYSPNLIKKTVVGAGKAEKEQIQAMIGYILPKANFTSADAADALAVAICHANHRSLKHLQKQIVNPS